MFKLTSVVKGNIEQPTEVSKDEWSTQKGLFADEENFYKRAQQEDRRYEHEMRLAKLWKLISIASLSAFVLALGWGMYGASRDHLQTKFVLVDRRTGDSEEVEANGKVTPPDIMMAREITWIGKCAFGASIDNVDLADCKIYREKVFTGNADRKLKLWLDIANKESKQRIVRVISRRQAGNDMTWDARYRVAAWDGPSPVRNYNLDVKFVFEYRQPIAGFLFGEGAGLFVKDVQIDEENT